jgi:hypothetical protein
MTGPHPHHLHRCQRLPQAAHLHQSAQPTSAGAHTPSSGWPSSCSLRPAPSPQRVPAPAGPLLPAASPASPTRPASSTSLPHLSRPVEGGATLIARLPHFGRSDPVGPRGQPLMITEGSGRRRGQILRDHEVILRLAVAVAWPGRRVSGLAGGSVLRLTGSGLTANVHWSGNPGASTPWAGSGRVCARQQPASF